MGKTAAQYTEDLYTLLAESEKEDGSLWGGMSMAIASGQDPIPTNIQQVNNQDISGNYLPTQLPAQGIGHGNRTPNGSAVTLSVVSVSAKYVYIKASSGNSGNITIGGSGVDASSGYELEPGDGISLPVPGGDLQNIYVYGGAGADKVQFLKLD